MTMVIFGMDPGLDGALAVLADNGYIQTTCWPTVALEKTNGGTKREYVEAQIVQMLRDARTGYGPHEVHAFLEKQQAMPGQGVTSMFSTGYGYGILRMALVALGIPWTLVGSQQWQKVMLANMVRTHKNSKDGKKAPKASAQAYLVCNRLWPGLNLLATERSRTPHSGICDALLIAEYGRRTLVGI